MEELIIYCLDDSELMEFNSINRGFRSDIYVEINDNVFQLIVYDIVRLCQDFESELNDQGFFAVDPNLIIVKEVAVDIIKQTIDKLHKQKYFDKIKPLSRDEIEKLTLTPC
ncbi:MAG: hypothetical protein HOO91_00005 [Bacteroidales bacterium]|nr:hypothetical protein [Bacteroidales bacterium]